MGDAIAKDMITNLPDSIIHHILSLLDEIKDVARTSVLSHRWNYLWTSLPDLVFDCERGSNVDEFMNFVDGTLHRHSLLYNVQKFSLWSSEHLDESRLSSWISNVVIRHKVEAVSLWLHQDHRLCVPLSVFTCETLTSLQLDIFRIDFPRYISLPRLKRLELVNIKLRNECWNEEMFTNCPVLEELYLDNCNIGMPSFCISIPTLQILRIHCYGLDHALKSLKIDAPSLVSFYYKGEVAKECVFSSFLTLAEAVVDLSYARYVRSRLEAFKQFLGALAHVKCLTVMNPPLQVNNLLMNSPVYHNVERLRITQAVNSDVAVIAFLKVTPNLESLIFQKAYIDIVDNGSEDNGWTSLELVDTGCLFRRLKSVCLNPCFWGAREISCVKVILRNAKALESLTIYHFNLRRISNLTEQELMLQINSFPRASPSCTFKLFPFGNQSLKHSREGILKFHNQ